MNLLDVNQRGVFKLHRTSVCVGSGPLNKGQPKVIQNNLSNRRGIYVGDDTNESLTYQLSKVE